MFKIVLFEQIHETDKEAKHSIYNHYYRFQSMLIIAIFWILNLSEFQCKSNILFDF